MTDPSLVPPVLDRAAAARWPLRAAAHVLGLGLVAAVVVALPEAPSDLDRHQLPKETAVHLATWLAVVLARPFPTAGLRRATGWACALLAAVTLASAVGATNLWIAARASALTITGIAAFLTARHLAAAGLDTLLIGWALVAAAVGTGGGLAQAYGVGTSLFASSRAPGGTFGNRNFMAHFAALALPATLAVALAARAWRALLATLLLAALAAAIVLSRSRAAWLGAGAAIGVTCVTLLVARRRGALPIPAGRPLLAALTMLGGIGAAIALPNALEWRSRSPYAETLGDLANHREGSGHGRMLQYRNTFELVVRHPVLGVGPGNWPIRYSDVAAPSDPSWAFNDPIPLNPWPSSDWMAVASERGVIAVAAILLLAIAVGWRAARGALAGGDRAMAGAALLALLTVAAVEGTFDAVLLLPTPLLAMAIVVAALLERVEGLAPPDATLPATSGSLALAATLVLGLIAARSVTQTGAYVVAGRGNDLDRLEWASRIDPGSYPIRIALAEKGSCGRVKDDARAALHMAPHWPRAILAARRCGVR